MGQGAKLTKGERETVLRALARLGENETTAVLGVSRHSLARALAAMSVRAGTLLLLRAGLTNLERRLAEERKDA